MPLRESRNIYDRPRRPLAGFETYYEITRSGDIYSVRLRRFIQRHHGGKYNGRDSFQFQIDNQVHEVGIYKSIAFSWLTPKQRGIIRNMTKRLEGEVLAEKTLELETLFQVSRYAISYLAHSAKRKPK